MSPGAGLNNNILKRLATVARVPVLLCALLIGIIWGSIALHLENERWNAEGIAVENITSLSGILAGALSHEFAEVDQTLDLIAEAYRSDPVHFDVGKWQQQNRPFERSVRYGIASPTDPARPRLGDELAIDAPVVDLTDGKAEIVFSRGISGSGGRVAFAAIGSDYLARTYEAAGINPGYFMLVGTDGIVRATGGVTMLKPGTDISGSGLLSRVTAGSVRWFYSDGTFGSHTDALTMLRPVNGFPLYVVVGVPSSKIFARLQRERRVRQMIGALFTLLIMGIGAIGVHTAMQRDLMTCENDLQAQRLNALMTNMPLGVCMNTGDGRIAVSNEHYRTMYGLTVEQVTPGTSFVNIIKARQAAATFIGDPESFARDLMANMAQGKVMRFSLDLPDGRVISVVNQPMGGGGWVSLHEDVTLQQLARDNLEHSNMLLKTTLSNIPHGVCMFGADHRLMTANDLYWTMYGLSPEQARPGITLREIIEARIAAGSSPKDTTKYMLDRLEEAFVPEPGYIINELRDGRVIAITRQAMPDGGSVAIHQDITAQKRAEERIAHLAHKDPLTGLANRTLFLQRVTEATQKCQEHGGRFAIHLLDLDHFKEVNDSLGHAVGDALLCDVARRLESCVGPGEVVARLGGDEFAVLQSLVDGDIAAAGILADRFLDVVAKAFDMHGHHLTVETSIGIALAPDHGTESNQLLKKADLALYKAKGDGRNNWCLFEQDMERKARTRLELAIDLREGVARRQFDIHYQPVVSTVTEELVGMEALVRWQHPQRGIVQPDNFIPLAESTGLIVPLGEWVLHETCAEAARWPKHVAVAVNLSPAQFRSGNLVDVVRGALRNAGLAPHRLELEVTEGVLLQHNEENLKTLHQLKELGVSIVLDDFGTGYSSMSYLRTFPFNKIKIDRTFVAELGLRDDCAAIVSAVSGLARSLNIAITAEGVETGGQLALLRAAGCGLAQGYLFGRPRPGAELDFSRAHRAAG